MAMVNKKSSLIFSLQKDSLRIQQPSKDQKHEPLCCVLLKMQTINGIIIASLAHQEAACLSKLVCKDLHHSEPNIQRTAEEKKSMDEALLEIS